jgi:hypothetical protein
VFKTALKILTASTAMVSALALFSADADANSRSRGSAFSGSPVMVIPQHGGFGIRELDLNPTNGFVIPRARNSSAPAQGAGAKPSSEDLMAGICNGAGGGASSQPDGTVHCVDPDGNDALPPVPAPKPD